MPAGHVQGPEISVFGEKDLRALDVLNPLSGFEFMVRVTFYAL